MSSTAETSKPSSAPIVPAPDGRPGVAGNDTGVLGLEVTTVASGAENLSEEVLIDVPTLLILGVKGTRPNPIIRDLRVGFTLARLANGIYLLQPTQGGRSITTKVAIVH